MKLLRFCLIPLAALALTSCIQVEQELTINADGSGTVNAHFAINQTTIEMIEAAQKQGDGAKPKNDFPMTVEDVKKKFEGKKDVTVKDVRLEDKDGKRHVYYVVEAKTLTALMEATEMTNINISKDADGNYTMWSEKKAEKPKTEEEKKMEKQMRALMMPMLKGLRLAMKINLPTEIIETTAHEKTEKSAAWVFDVDKDPSFLDDEPQFKVKFKGAGLSLPEVKATPEKDEAPEGDGDEMPALPPAKP